MGDRPIARPLPTQGDTNAKKRFHTSMPRAGFETTIPVLSMRQRQRDVNILWGSTATAMKSSVFWN
jgi:hypothetical protein